MEVPVLPFGPGVEAGVEETGFKGTLPGGGGVTTVVAGAVELVPGTMGLTGLNGGTPPGKTGLIGLGGGGTDPKFDLPPG
jgi:hypothetical protein